MAGQGKFSEERLFKIRRLRKARFYYKQTPLFAFQRMQEEYKDYSHADFLDDLRLRTPKKKRKGKGNLQNYGRYSRICELMAEYSLTGNTDLVIQASKLKQRIAQPYRVKVRIEKKSVEYSFSARIPITQIEKLVADLATVSSEQQADDIINAFRKYQRK